MIGKKLATHISKWWTNTKQNNEIMTTISAIIITVLILSPFVYYEFKAIPQESDMAIPRKEMTLQELEELIGKDQVKRLFLEHYLILVGKDKAVVKLTDDLTLNDIME